VWAGECLESQQLLVLEVPDRLIGDLQALLVEQPVDRVELLRGRDGDLGPDVVDVDRVAPTAALGLVERGVGLVAREIGRAAWRGRVSI
jgi:hypothetical protein